MFTPSKDRVADVITLSISVISSSAISIFSPLFPWKHRNQIGTYRIIKLNEEKETIEKDNMQKHEEKVADEHEDSKIIYRGWKVMPYIIGN